MPSKALLLSLPGAAALCSSSWRGDPSHKIMLLLLPNRNVAVVNCNVSICHVGYLILESCERVICHTQPSPQRGSCQDGSQCSKEEKAE